MKRSPSADRHAWEDAFIAGLRAYGMASRAAQAAGVSDSTPYARRKRSAAFRQRWDQTLADYHARRPAKLRETALAVEALKIFQARKIDDLIVVNNKREPVGLIDSQDLPKLKLA